MIQEPKEMDLIESMFESHAGINFHPVQDFHDGKMYYGLSKRGSSSVINSLFKEESISALVKKGLKPLIDDVQMICLQKSWAMKSF